MGGDEALGLRPEGADLEGAVGGRDVGWAGWMGWG